MEIQSVVSYAKARGVRVVPEIDTPGHSEAMCAGCKIFLLIIDPELCPSPTCKTPLDLTKDNTFAFLEKLFNELQETFFDSYFHIGK